MEGSPHINVPHVDTQDPNFDPNIKLPDHLREFKTLADAARHKATPVLQSVLALMDNAALRTAALPEPQ